MSSKNDVTDRKADPLKQNKRLVKERKYDGFDVMVAGEEDAASSSRTPYMKKYRSFSKQRGRGRGRGRGRESQEDDLEMGTRGDTRGTGSPSGCPARCPPGCPPGPELDSPRQEIEGLVQQSGENSGKPRKSTGQEWTETLKRKRQFMIPIVAVSFWSLYITAAIGFPLVTNAVGYHTEPASSDKILPQCLLAFWYLSTIFIVALEFIDHGYTLVLLCLLPLTS